MIVLCGKSQKKLLGIYMVSHVPQIAVCKRFIWLLKSSDLRSLLCDGYFEEEGAVLGVMPGAGTGSAASFLPTSLGGAGFASRNV